MLPKRVGIPNRNASYSFSVSTVAIGYPSFAGAFILPRISGDKVSATLDVCGSIQETSLSGQSYW